MLVLGFAAIVGMFFALENADVSSVVIPTSKIILYSFLLSLIPVGSYTGFVFVGLRIIEKGKFGKFALVMLLVFFPITVAIITVSGIILIIPSIIKAVKGLKE